MRAKRGPDVPFQEMSHQGGKVFSTLPHGVMQEVEDAWSQRHSWGAGRVSDLLQDMSGCDAQLEITMLPVMIAMQYCHGCTQMPKLLLHVEIERQKITLNSCMLLSACASRFTRGPTLLRLLIIAPAYARLRLIKDQQK